MIPTVETQQLKNGLTVLTCRQSHTPLVSFWLWYHVGSRNETPGSSGLSHWVEHMMFKGTPTFPGSTLDKLINESGGQWNAFTTPDSTAYYATMPYNRLDTLLRIECDRITHTRFLPTEVESERTVVLSERAGYENYPEYWLEEAVESVAFRVHPYRLPVLGYRHDIEHITRDELYNHYRQYYTPANALAVAVGGFETSHLIELLEATLGTLPAGCPADVIHQEEPLQQGERSIAVRRPGPTCYVHIAYHVPEAGHPDMVALTLIDAILSGGKPPCAWSPEKEMGRSSRLYQLLVDGGLATEVTTGVHPTTDPGLFRVEVTLRPEADGTQVEDMVIKAVEGLAADPISSEELERARKQCVAQLAYASEGVENLALLLGAYAITGHPEYLSNLADALYTCSEERIRKVAAAYLHRDNRTIGRFIPCDEDEPEEDSMTDSDDESTPQSSPQESASTTAAHMAHDEHILQAARHAAGLSTLPPLSFDTALPGPEQILRVDVAPGITSMACAAHGDIVTLSITSSCGTASEEPNRAGLAELVNAALLRGTTLRSGIELHTMADALGMGLTTSCSDERSSLEITCLADDVEKAVDLLAEIWLSPAFSKEDIAQVKGQQLTRIREREDDTRAVADRIWRELAYAGHPFAHPTDGYADVVESITPQQCRAFQTQQVLSAPQIVCAAGAIDPQRAVDLISAAWQRVGHPEAHPTRLLIPDVPLPDHRVYRRVPMAGKSQTDVALGLPTLARSAHDFPAFYLGHLILGRLGLYGRLGAHIREKLGLAYYVYADLELRTSASPWIIRAGVEPTKLTQAMDAILGEVRTITTMPIRHTELAEAVGYVVGSLPTAIEAAADVADVLVDLEFYQLGLDYLQTYSKRIGAITPEEVQAALARYLSVDHLIQVVAGP